MDLTIDNFVSAENSPTMEQDPEALVRSRPM